MLPQHRLCSGLSARRVFFTVVAGLYAECSGASFSLLLAQGAGLIRVSARQRADPVCGSCCPTRRSAEWADFQSSLCVGHALHGGCLPLSASFCAGCGRSHKAWRCLAPVRLAMDATSGLASLRLTPTISFHVWKFGFGGWLLMSMIGAILWLGQVRGCLSVRHRHR